VSAEPPKHKSPAAWEAFRKAESAKSVAAGGRPIERMATSPVPHMSWGRRVDVLRAYEGQLMRSSWGGSLHKETGATLLGTHDDQVMLFVDQAAVDLAARLLANEGQHQAAAALPYLVRQGYACRYVCLLSSLCVRWWDPFDRRGSLQQWAKALGVCPGDDFSVARRVYSLLSSGLAAPDEVDSAARKLAAAAVKSSLPSQFKAYDFSRALSELWGALSRRDPNLEEKYRLSGEVVRCQPLRFGGGLILGQLSVPCKLRTGTVIVYAQDLEVNAELVRFLGRDDQGNEGLFCELSIGKWGWKSEALLRSWQAGGTWSLTASPYTARPSAQRAMWLTKKRSLPAASATIEREVPVDVVLAGS